MSNLFATGTSALLGYQRSLATVGNNVANANTPGYSRQVAELATRSTPGVQVQDVKRLSDALATSRVLDSSGEVNRLEQLSSHSDDVDKLFSDKATNLGGVWSKFFDSLSALSTDPSSTTSRNAVLQGANTLAGRFKQLDGDLDQMGRDVNASLKDSVTQINDLTTQIAALNKQVVHASSASLEVLDKRDSLIEKLVGITGGNVVTQNDGSINVYTSGGQALVVGTTPLAMTTYSDPYQSDRLNLALVAQGQTIPLGNDVIGGKLGGLLEFRSSVLDPAAAELGRLAVGLAERMNTAQAAGVDLYGDRGGDLFSIGQPQLQENAGNTGSATLSGSIADVSKVDGQNILLRYDGTAWSASRADTGASLTLTGTGTTADPLVVNGVAT
ncbi:flagellar hook-associated protein FlgK, partial [Xanthomonas sp. Kuri4-3]